MAFRHTAAFVSDWRPHSRILDRNERAKIMALADALERRTKPAGKRNGVLGYFRPAGLDVRLPEPSKRPLLP
jgi:hypothetical protein